MYDYELTVHLLEQTKAGFTFTRVRVRYPRYGYGRHEFACIPIAAVQAFTLIRVLYGYDLRSYELQAYMYLRAYCFYVTRSTGKHSISYLYRTYS